MVMTVGEVFLKDSYELEIWGDNPVSKHIGAGRVILMIATFVYWLLWYLIGDFSWGVISFRVVLGVLLAMVLILAGTDFLGLLSLVLKRPKDLAQAHLWVPLLLNTLTLLMMVLGWYLFLYQGETPAEPAG